MTKEQLTTDFSKRFNEASPHLIFTHSGVLCTLLGSITQRSLTCTLSMGVTAAARRTNTGYIKIEHTDTNICSRIKPDTLCIPFERDFNGADILLHSDIIKGFDPDPCMKAAAAKALLRLNHAAQTDPHAAAAMCDKGKDMNIYTALMSAKQCYCTYMDGAEIRHYPLPVTGMLFLCVALGQTSPRDVRSAQYIDSENSRIKSARIALKAYKLSRFAELVNESAAAIPKLSREQRFLTQIMPRIDGCLFARASDGNIIALTDESKTDYVIQCVRNKFEAVFGKRPHFAVARSSLQKYSPKSSKNPQ